MSIYNRTLFEDLMASLFKESIFDLPTLARLAVKQLQEQAQAENRPPTGDVLIYEGYILVGTND